MKKIIALGLAAVMALSMAGCGGGGSSTPEKNTQAAATSKSDGKTLNVYMSSEPAHLDPALNSSVDGACLAVNCFEGLLRYNANGELENACAESYEVSDDACTYTFTLKDGLKWSNGEPLTAKDFAYSILRAGSPELAADYAYLCEGVFAGFTYEKGIPADSVVASEDGKTLTIKLAAPCPYFATLMAFPTFFPVYEPSVEATKSAEQPGGTWANDAGETFVSNGAFKLQSWNHDSDMTYVKNENYWDADTVSIETLNIMLTSDDATAYAAYQAGNLDFIDSVPNDEMKAAMESPEFHIIDQLGTYYCGFNYNSKLYDELGLDEDQATQFRKAIALLIDRQYICDTIGQTGQVPASTFVPAGCSDSNGGEFKNTDYYDAANYEANLAEAKEILASIGLMDSPDAEKVNKTVAFTYLTNDSEGNVKIAEALQSDLAQVGIDLTIDQQEWNVFLDTRKNGQFDFCREGWVMDYDDPVNMLEMWLTNSGNNDMQFGRDTSKKLDWTKYDQLINEIKSETDLAKRAEKMHEAEDLLMSTWAVIPLYYYNDPYMLKGYVENVYGTALGNKYFYHATIKTE